MVSKALLTSKSDEHYTPLRFLGRVVEFFGGDIDLDPCSAPNALVPAQTKYTPAMNGLRLPWIGKVFVNPPYGRSLKQWTEKAVNEHKSGNAEQILYLVPSRTDTQWTKMLSGYSRCYLHGRLKFADERGVPQNSAPFPSVVFHLSDEPNGFAEYWSRFGEIVEREQPSRKAGFDKKAYQREYMRKRRAKAKRS